MPKNIAKQVENAIARDRDTIEQEKNTEGKKDKEKPGIFYNVK